MKSIVAISLSFALGWSLPTIAFAEDAVEQLRQFVANVKSAEGDFLQQQVNPRGTPDGKPKVVRQSSGQFMFVRPGKFVWETHKPFEQKMIADGKQLILWDKDLNQATYRPANQALATTPAAILFGDTSIEQYFTLTLVGQKGGVDWVELTPKSQRTGMDDIPYAKIGIGMVNNQPQAMELQDNFGNVVLLTLSKIKTNVAIPSSKFNFSAPASAEVVRMK